MFIGTVWVQVDDEAARTEEMEARVFRRKLIGLINADVENIEGVVGAKLFSVVKLVNKCARLSKYLAGTNPPFLSILSLPQN